MQTKCYGISLEEPTSPVAQESCHKQKRTIKSEESRAIQIGSTMRKNTEEGKHMEIFGNSKQCKIKYPRGSCSINIY